MSEHDFRHSDDSVDHYTPFDITEAEHDVFGGIDFDPASCAAANRIVGARRFYTVADNGFSRIWRARTAHVNPPGGKCDVTGRPVYTATKKRRSCLETGSCGLPPGRRDGDVLIPGHAHEGVTSSAKAWWFKLALSYELFDVESAFFICFNLDIFQTTQVKTPVFEDPATGELRLLPTPLDFDFCIPSVRLEYLYEGEDGSLHSGKSPTHASAIILLSRDDAVRRAFQTRFSDFGKVKMA